MTEEDQSPPARRDPLAAVRRLSTVRARCEAVAHALEGGRSGHFRLDADALPRLVERLQAAGAGLAGPGHTAAAIDTGPPPRGDRWAALQAGGRDRAAALLAAAARDGDAGEARTNAAYDLALLLALMDSQAARDWHFDEPATAFAPGGAGVGVAVAVDPLALPVEQHASDDLFAMLDRFTPPPSSAAPISPAPSPVAPAATPPRGTRWTGSTALSLATAQALAAGVFSSQRSAPVQADAAALRRLDAAALRAALQAGASNPLPGLEARATALSRLGQRLGEQAAREGGLARPARWVRQAIDAARDAQDPSRVHAPRMAAWLARRLAEVTPGGRQVLGLPAGEVSPHLWAGAQSGADPATLSEAAQPDAAARTADPGTGGWVPFHTMAQSLVRTLRSALAEQGLALVGLDDLADSGAERHVALMLDSGLLLPRSPAVLARPLAASGEAVVEARAAAIHWLPLAAAKARQALLAGGAASPPSADALIEAACAALPQAGAGRLSVLGEDGAW